MTKWLKCIIPCLKNKQLKTSQPENKNATNFDDSKINYGNNKENNVLPDKKDIQINIMENSETELYTENLTKCNTNVFNNDENKIDISTEFNNEMHGENENKNYYPRKHIACTLHESLYDFCTAKLTHTSLKPRSPLKYNVSNNSKEKPHNTLVFQTVLLNGEPCTTRYKITEEPVTENNKHCGEMKQDEKLREEIKDSDIKLVFSHDVLEYLTKSFLHNKDNDLNRSNTGENDLVVCTLFPKQLNSTDENDCDMEIDNNCELSTGKNMNNETQNAMEIDEISNYTDNSTSTVHTDNDNIFNEPQMCSRREYRLVSNNPLININSSISKSSPHMQDCSGSGNNKEMTRLRRNISKKVSWKENVEVCFFNHSSKSANEILQEVQPLIDHEVYWKECVGEMDRKRREKWLKIRADEQRCLTGDGQFHDYFTCRLHHLDDDELSISLID